jgi:hypothetical protein
MICAITVLQVEVESPILRAASHTLRISDIGLRPFLNLRAISSLAIVDDILSCLCLLLLFEVLNVQHLLLLIALRPS